jgi:hypothetical protein
MIFTSDMRTRRIIVSILVIIFGIALLILWPASKHGGENSKKAVQTLESSATETSLILAFKEGQQTSATAMATGNSFTSAQEMATFIDQVIDSVPLERSATRDHLMGIQAVFFISDYVMAAKTNSTLTLSETKVVAAFTNAAHGTSFVTDRLRLWAVRRGTLADHYQNISEIPSDKKTIDAIKAALIANRFAVDPESDLLMDCIRYVVHNTGIHEVYGSHPSRMETATPFPAELNSLDNTGETVFRHRFTERFGMDPGTATNLMRQIGDLRLYDLSPADVEIPVSGFQ